MGTNREDRGGHRVESTVSKYVLLKTKADTPQEKGTGGGVGSEAYLFSHVSKGLLDGER